MTDLFLTTYDILIGFNRCLKVSVQTEKRKFKFSNLGSSLTVLFSSSVGNSWSLLIALFIKTIAQTLLCFCCYAVSFCLYYKDDVFASCGWEWYSGGELRAVTLEFFGVCAVELFCFSPFQSDLGFELVDVWWWTSAQDERKAAYCC